MDRPNPLQLESIVGFSGNCPHGLLKHPDGVHLLYPLGANIVVRNQNNPNIETFLSGHTNNISCMTISKSGNWVASGQSTHMGFQADIILWDFAGRKQVKKFSLHKGKVATIAFSPNEKFLASLGGEDDNSVIVWDLEKGSAICGTVASKDSAGVAHTLGFFNNSDLHFVTGGNATLRVWEILPGQRKCNAVDCQTGQIKRVVHCVTIDAEDENMYCGTTTGDILKVNLKTKLFKQSGPTKEKELFHKGVSVVVLSPDKEHLIVGTGDGTVASLKVNTLQIKQKTKVNGSVTSITFDTLKEFYVGTSTSSIYRLKLADLSSEMLSTCHYGKINDIVFPYGLSDLFATASVQEVRIWNAQTTKELLRIHVPNLECQCVTFNKDGTSLITGWSDAKIRSFGPETGRPQYIINDAHQGGVTAITVTDAFNSAGDYRIISGGEGGQVRIWKITKHTQSLETAMKEHKGTVTCIKIRHNNMECVSSSSDGSCIIWDLTRFVRNQVLFAPSFFKAVCYYPDESQLLTSGTDRKVAYWEAYDGSLIRELECSESDAINGLDISSDGKYFVCGGSDKVMKVYRYEEGDIVFEGHGHSSEITKVRISPNQKHVVSVSADGAIFTWKFPKDAVAASSSAVKTNPK